MRELQNPDLFFKKTLDPRWWRCMFRVPSVNGIANQTVTHNKRRRGSFEASEDFLIKNGKLIDGASKKFFADSLSLIGKLFEIYFVRLIGTPNQNSKNGSSFGWSRV